MVQHAIVGYQGQVRSLGGVIGSKGFGLSVERPSTVITVTAVQEILHNNPLRKWAIIQNTGAVVALIAFDSGSGIAATFELLPDAIFQIDEVLPWTGAVTAESAGTTITYMEASLISEA